MADRPTPETLFSVAFVPRPMNTASVAGSVLTAAGLAGYAIGVVEPYPGRAFSVTGVMIGVTLLAIGAGTDSSDASGQSPAFGGDSS